MNRRAFMKFLALIGIVALPGVAATSQAKSTVPAEVWKPEGEAFRHKGCKTEIFRYMGMVPLSSKLIMRSSEWLVFGKPVEPFSSAIVRCPDCG